MNTKHTRTHKLASHMLALRVAYMRLARETELAAVHLDAGNPIQRSRLASMREALAALTETEQHAFDALAGGR